MITNTITQIRGKTTKNKSKKQRPTNKQTLKRKKQNNNNNRKIKNNRKVKAMGKITPTMDHYPRNG